MPASPSTAPAPQMSDADKNRYARQLIIQGGVVPTKDGNVLFRPAVNMWQPLNPQITASPAPGSILTFQLRNVGLVKRCLLQFKATVTAGATSQQNLTKWGLQNLISNVIFTDLGNNQRINTQAWHLTAVASAKRRAVFGAAYTSDTPLGYGNVNNRIMYAPQTIAANGTTEIDFVLEIPFTKNDMDLRGAIFADVTNASMQIQVTLNPNMFVSSTADPTLAMYQSAGSDLASLSNLTVQLYQNYLDQLPRIGGLPILPQQDIATAYMLNNAVSGLPIANQDNSFSFLNSRSYESITFAYDNNGVLNVNGSDVNSYKLQSANFTNIYDLNGRMLGLMCRNVLGDDFPAGMEYMDFRDRPIDTNQYGNMQLVINPSSVGGSGAYFLYGLESFGVIGLVNQGGSLQSGGGS